LFHFSLSPIRKFRARSMPIWGSGFLPSPDTAGGRRYSTTWEAPSGQLEVEAGTGGASPGKRPLTTASPVGSPLRQDSFTPSWVVSKVLVQRTDDSTWVDSPTPWKRILRLASSIMVSKSRRRL